MHLLVAQKGSLSDGDEAVDLGQSPGDVLFLSAADTELASIAAARQMAGSLKWRLASLSDLKHPMSVDTFVSKMGRHAKLVIVRALGGASYFSYTLESLHAAAQAHGFKIAALPGDDRPDPGLDPLSTLDPETREQLWAYLIEGGAENARGFIDCAEALIDGGEMPGPAAPLLKAGLWHPQTSNLALADLRKGWIPRAPVAAICFYRALVQSGQTAPVAALCEALADQGINALPVFVSSLKDPVSVGTVEAIFAEAAPDVVINATAASLQGEVPPLPDDLLSDNAACYDMMYSDKDTAFVTWAKQHSAAKAIDGLGMLVEQAAEAFRLWRDVKPDTTPVTDMIRNKQL